MAELTRVVSPMGEGSGSGHRVVHEGHGRVLVSPDGQLTIEVQVGRAWWSRTMPADAAELLQLDLAEAAAQAGEG